MFELLSHPDVLLVGVLEDIEELRLALKKLSSIDLHDATDDEVTRAAVEMQALRSSFDAVHARVVGAFARSRVWAADGAKSPTAWLARATRAPKAELGSLLRLERSRRLAPQVHEAWEAGEIGTAQVRRLHTLINNRTYRDWRRDEAMLVDSARELPFAEFAQVCDYWKLHADPDGADDDEMERRSRRQASFDQTLSGMWAGNVLLDPVSGTVVANELQRLERQLFEVDWSDARDRLGREPTTVELARTTAQRFADALVEMARRSAAAMPGASSKPLFTVVLGSESFRRLCELADGTVVAPKALSRWIDDAQVEAIVFDQLGERAIKASRTRRFTGVLRRILDVRDRRCYHPWCDVPAPACQGDHIVPYEAGGMTSQENGRLACGHHNRLAYHQRRPPPDDGW